MNQLQIEIHALAREKGWWPDPASNTVIPAKLMLIVSEAAEALEEFRDPKNDLMMWTDRATRKPCGFGIELADVIIRVLDLAEWLHIDMGEMITIKHAYNKTRAYRHGGKLV